MARILPDAPGGAVTPEASRVHRLLKRLPDDEYTVWQRLSIWTEPGPDFWVLCPNGRGLFIKISVATVKEAQAARQPSFLAALYEAQEAPEPLAQAEANDLAAFATRVAASANGFELSAASLHGAILFPNVPQADLKVAAIAGKDFGVTWAGKEVLAPDRFGEWLREALGPAISEQAVEHLRRAFTPEAVVPVHLTVRGALERHTEAELTSYLLDYDQEYALKLDLRPPGEDQVMARDLGLRLINGVAGSGKSLILVYRAHLLRQFFPNKRILALTHNRPLAQDLEQRYLRLSGGDKSIPWKTFMGWCRSVWPVAWQEPIGQQARGALVESVCADKLAGTSITPRMFQDEIDWVKDRMLRGREDYLSADRTGRGFALTDALRERVYAAMLAYQRELRRRGKLDWGDVPRRMLHYIDTGTVSPARYDYILIDEAQFFAPIWFEIVRRILVPGKGQLFMAADPKQGFLKRRQSWLASGLDVRGRSVQLARSYRTTREILDFATLLYRSKAVRDDDEEIVVPSLLDMPHGVPPLLIPLTSGQDEVTRVTNEIRVLLGVNVKPEHILVIHANWQGAERVLLRLRREFGPAIAADPKQKSTGPHIRVCTLNAATGLESPIVFLMGAHQLYEEEQSLRLSDREREELIRDNTRKLYMAITRAGQRLVLTYVGRLPKELEQLMGKPAARVV